MEGLEAIDTVAGIIVETVQGTPEFAFLTLNGCVPSGINARKLERIWCSMKYNVGLEEPDARLP